jgi:serine/threonine protein kinase
MNCLLQGDSTLLDFMKQRNFPENLEMPLFGRTLKSKDQLQRHSLIIKQIMRQIISSLNKMHATGIVHRDVKPSNLVVTNKGKLKFIDFGAATDLRVGKNFVPERGMLDPDYCPPELYVLPEETPNPPPAPVAAALSPFIWQVKNYISKMGVSDHVFWWGIDAYMCNVSLLAFKLLLLQEMQQKQETAIFPRMVCPDFGQIIIPSSTSPLGTDEVSSG